MRKLVLACTAMMMLLSAPAARAIDQGERRQNASVELSVTDAQGKSIELGALPQAERQRVISLRNSLQQWGNQQSQRVSVTIRCTFRPLNCSITIAF